jgi:predicted transcriptional regulator
MTSSKAVKLDEATYDRLKALAQSRDRTPHWLMKQAIRQFLEREEEAEHIRNESLERWKRFEANGEAVTHQTVETWLESWGTDSEDPCPVRGV